jgi:monofunctional biosynthetic peptidoglycan transglycosylase
VSREQAALLAAVLPNPRKWSPVRPTSFIMQRKAFILRYMNRFKPLRN